MTERKVIEDSDEDDNAEAISPPESLPATSEQTLTTVTDDGASITADILQRSASPSTASTERLNNEIRTAHKALIEPTPDSSLPSTRVLSSLQQLSQTSPTAAKSTRRRTKTSAETSKKRKGLRTYASQGRDMFESCEGTDGEVHTPREFLDIRATKLLKLAEESKIGSTWVWGSGDTEVIESGMSFTDRGVSTESSIPPPATKPTPFEQTQRSETSTVAMVLEPTPAAPKLPGDTDSFQLSYSDGRMPTPTMSSRDRGDEANTTDLKNASSSHKRSSTEIEFSHLGQPNLAEPNSTAPESLPGRNITVDTGTRPATLAHEVQIFEVTGHPITKSIVLLPQLEQEDDGQDELSLGISTSGATSKSHVKPSQEKYQLPEQLDELGFDDTTIGLPRELYQPRPSKSRSGRKNGQIMIPADYSKRPEAVAKKKRRLSRRKTTAFHELISKEEYADDEDDVGISTRPSLNSPRPKAIEPSMEQDELGLEKDDKAGEILRDTEPEDKSTAKPTVSVKQQGRPKNGAGEAAESRSRSHDEPGPQKKEEQDEVKDTEADSGLEVKAPTKPNESKKQRGRPRKGAAEASNTKVRGKTPDELAQHEPKLTNNETTSLDRKPRKKGVASETFKEVSEELGHDSEDEPLVADESENLSNDILCEIQGNILLPNPTERAPRSSPTSKSMSAAPETPHKAAGSHKRPDKHSPISGGKVAYRVGLSKRARIEPLLRIVRKC
ncbi:hypothetical protein N7G274_002975 [Stereocaulon virgatum]|uniref:Uncharacterized protein n=1 Tax=Stereocaulon virgatum TaxID=373712 RepID=A0ABR4AER3_9LECA